MKKTKKLQKKVQDQAYLPKYGSALIGLLKNKELDKYDLCISYLQDNIYKILFEKRKSSLLYLVYRSGTSIKNGKRFNFDFSDKLKIIKKSYGNNSILFIGFICDNEVCILSLKQFYEYKTKKNMITIKREKDYSFKIGAKGKSKSPTVSINNYELLFK